MPLEARVLVVCDVFDPLVHARPYWRTSTFEEAIRELRTLTQGGSLMVMFSKFSLEFFPNTTPPGQRGKLLSFTQG